MLELIHSSDVLKIYGTVQALEDEKRLSLQKHLHRSEHWVVVSGTAKVTNGDKEFIVHIIEYFTQWNSK